MMMHDNRDIPSTKYRNRWNCDIACYRCGIWDGGLSTDCEKLSADESMKRYQAGGNLDPFAGYRDISTDYVTVTYEDERRPGLVAETIDHEAYDAFMKGLG